MRRYPTVMQTPQGPVIRIAAITGRSIGELERGEARYGR